jgi:hypothetical protein
MSRIQFIEHEGVRILFLDFSGFDDPAEVVEPIEEAKRVIAQEPEGSLLTLTYVKDSKFNAEMAQALWRFARHNKPYVKAGAVVGIEGLQKDLYHLVMNLSRRKLPPFDDVEKAKHWLATQA